MEGTRKLAAEQHTLFNYSLLVYLVGLLLATMVFINQYSMVTYRVSCLSDVTEAYGTSKCLYSAATMLPIHSKPGTSSFSNMSLSCAD